MSSRFRYAASGAGANVEKKVAKKPIQLAWKHRMCGSAKLQICSSVALCSASTAHLNGRPYRSRLAGDKAECHIVNRWTVHTAAEGIALSGIRCLQKPRRLWQSNCGARNAVLHGGRAVDLLGSILHDGRLLRLRHPDLDAWSFGGWRRRTRASGM